VLVAAALAAPAGAAAGSPSCRRPSRRRLANALMVNDAGAIEDVESDVAGVFEDEALIANAIYEEVR
jgi:hypothetical protein